MRPGVKTPWRRKGGGGRSRRRVRASACAARGKGACARRGQGSDTAKEIRIRHRHGPPPWVAPQSPQGLAKLMLGRHFRAARQGWREGAAAGGRSTAWTFSDGAPPAGGARPLPRPAPTNPRVPSGPAASRSTTWDTAPRGASVLAARGGAHGTPARGGALWAAGVDQTAKETFSSPARRVAPEHPSLFSENSVCHHIQRTDSVPRPAPTCARHRQRQIGRARDLADVLLPAQPLWHRLLGRLALAMHAPDVDGARVAPAALQEERELHVAPRLQFPLACESARLPTAVTESKVAPTRAEAAGAPGRPSPRPTARSESRGPSAPGAAPRT